MLTLINKDELKQGDIVGVPFKQRMGCSYGWTTFRYPEIVPMKIVRITPCRSKFYMEDGSFYTKYCDFYVYDEEAKYVTKLVKSVCGINRNLFKFSEMRKNEDLFQKEDEVLLSFAEALEQAMAIIEGNQEE